MWLQRSRESYKSPIFFLPSKILQQTEEKCINQLWVPPADSAQPEGNSSPTQVTKVSKNSGQDLPVSTSLQKKKKQGAFHEISPTFKDLCMFFRFWGKSNTRSHYNSPWYDVFSTSWKNLAHLGKTQMILNFLSLPHTQHELRSKPVCSIRGPYHGFLYIPTYYIYITGWYNPESPVDTTRQSIHPPLPPPPSETRKLQVIQGLSPFLAQTFFWPGSLPKGF